MTKSGKLFFNGQNKRLQVGNCDENDHQQHFWEIPEDFYPRDVNDKIVDIASGRHNNVIVTESGKVYAAGYALYVALRNCRHNSKNHENYPFEIKLPEGFKAFEAYASGYYNVIWINAKNAEGKTVLLSGGDVA